MYSIIPTQNCLASITTMLCFLGTPWCLKAGGTTSLTTFRPIHRSTRRQSGARLETATTTMRWRLKKKLLPPTSFTGALATSRLCRFARASLRTRALRLTASASFSLSAHCVGVARFARARIRGRGRQRCRLQSKVSAAERQHQCVFSRLCLRLLTTCARF